MRILSRRSVRIASHIRRVRPHVVLTFGPEGGYGHPDHIAISQLTTSAVVYAAQYGGADPAQKSIRLMRCRSCTTLAWTSRKWSAYQAALKKLTSTVDGVERQATPWPDWAVTTVIDTSQLLADRLACGLVSRKPDVGLSEPAEPARGTASRHSGERRSSIARSAS